MRGRAWVAGESSLPWGAGGFPSSGKLTRIELVEHFTASNDGLIGIFQATSGTGAAVSASVAAAPAGRIGIAELSTGTDTTGRATVINNVNALLFGGGRWRFRCDAAVPTASDGTETFTVRLGFIDSSSVDSTDGAYFRYTHGTNGGEWECITRSNSTETASDSSVALSAGTYRAFEIEVNADASSVAFYVDGALVATHTTNIPSGAGRNTAYGAAIVKSAGTTARSLYLDLIAWSFEPSTPL